MAEEKDDSSLQLELYRSSAIGGVYTVRLDEQYTLLYGNDLYFQLHEWPAEELLGKSCCLFVYPDDFKIIQETLSQAQKQGQTHAEWEMRIVTKAHKIKYTLVSGRFSSRKGEAVFEGYITDISQQKNLERKIDELVELERDLRTQVNLYRSSDLGGVFSVYLNEGCSLIYGNDKYYQIHEYTPHELLEHLNNDCIRYVHPLDLQTVRNTIQAALDVQKERIEWEMRVITGKGNIRYILCSGAIVYKTHSPYPIMNGVAIDLSKQKIIENKLIESDQRYKIAVDGAQLNIWEYDIQTKRIIQSESSAQVHGYDLIVENVPESLIETNYVSEDEQEKFLNMYRRILAGEKTISEDFWVRTAPRREPWCERITYTVLCDPEGTPVKAYGLSQDITPIKLAEKKYQEELLSRDHDGSTPIASCRINLSTRCVEDLSIAGETLSPKKASTLSTYKECLDVFLHKVQLTAQQEKDFSTETLSGLYQKGISNWSSDFLAQRSPDSYIWARCEVNLIKRQEHGHIIAYFYLRDVTQKRMLQDIVRSIIGTDYDYAGVINANRGTYSLLANREDTVLPPQAAVYDQAMQDFILNYCPDKDASKHVAPLFLKNIQKQLTKADFFVYELDIREADGSIRRKQCKYSYMNEEAGFIIITRSDIDGIVKKELAKQELLEKTVAMAERANAAKSSFMARMSHDMRTPMNAIIGFSSLGLDEAPLGALRDYFSNIGISAKYLLGLVNDVLDMEKLEQDAVILTPEAYSAAEFFQHLSITIGPACRHKNINFLCNLKELENKNWKIDKLRFNQIFLNLLTNAIKFTPEHGTIRLMAKQLSHRGTTSRFLFEVSDTGIGMNPDFQKKVFEPFAQERAAIPSRSEGSGLGLSITKKMVQLMGGEIAFTSTQGVGTTFTVELDLETIESVPTKAHANVEEQAPLQGKRILLCEDHPLNVQIAKKLLEKVGVVVDHAENGAEGLRLFSSHSERYYDAILMDIQMPIMDGIACAQAIRALNRSDAQTVPVIAMTANAYAEDREKSKGAGMNAHLAKPIDPQQLYKELRNCIYSPVSTK